MDKFLENGVQYILDENVCRILIVVLYQLLEWMRLLWWTLS